MKIPTQRIIARTLLTLFIATGVSVFITGCSTPSQRHDARVDSRVDNRVDRRHSGY